MGYLYIDIKFIIWPIKILTDENRKNTNVYFCTNVISRKKMVYTNFIKWNYATKIEIFIFYNPLVTKILYYLFILYTIVYSNLEPKITEKTQVKNIDDDSGSGFIIFLSKGFGLILVSKLSKSFVSRTGLFVKVLALVFLHYYVFALLLCNKIIRVWAYMFKLIGFFMVL